MDKIQKIKAKIGKLKSEYNKESDFRTVRGDTAREVLDKLFSFIDSLPEEPSVRGITWEDVNTLESLIYQVHNEYPSIGEKSFGLEVLERFQGCQDDVEEHNEDLEEEFYSWMRENCDDNGFFNQLKLARHFAEWQREKDIKLEKIDDLEEFAQKWAYSNYHKELDEVNCGCLYSGVKKGAEWQKQKDLEDSLKSDMTMPNKFYEKGRFDMREEMMKDAVLETKVMMDCDGDGIETPYEEWLTLENKEIQYIPDNLGLKDGDKVKIIIIKED